ncbi:hypothetical protein [Novosphingobium sp.]|uniref:hypothetical protein n=1 Tax=Novosphingobium sp. TaxID=1874826 RepID=UPI003BAB6025
MLAPTQAGGLGGDRGAAEILDDAGLRPDIERTILPTVDTDLVGITDIGIRGPGFT